MKKLLLFLTIALLACNTTKITYTTKDSKGVSITESFTIKYKKGVPVAWKSKYSNDKWMPMYNESAKLNNNRIK
jgi:hypothetical protein